MTIQPATQVWLIFARVKSPFSEAIVTHAMIECTILKLGFIASISPQLALLALYCNPTEVLAASPYHVHVSLIVLYARLIFRLSVSFPVHNIFILLVFIFR
jgi:hypothetical protein